LARPVPNGLRVKGRSLSPSTFVFAFALDS
jgi:hypothetical protein